MIVIIWDRSHLDYSDVFDEAIFIRTYMRVFVSILSNLFANFFRLYSTRKNVLACFLPLPSFSLYGTGETAYTSQLTAVESLLHARQGNAPWVLSGEFQVGDLWPRLISTWRQNRALLRDRFRLRDSKARLSAIFPAEDSVGSLSHSVCPPYALERPELSSLCTRKMPAGDTSRLSAPMNRPWCCGGACNRFNTATEIRSIHRYARNFRV